MINPFRRLGAQLVNMRVRNTEAMVAEPQHAGRRLVRQDMAIWLVVFVCWIAYVMTDKNSAVSWVALPVVGGFLGAQCLRRVTRAQAYRTGWLDGRLQMISALAEAERRGMTLHDWAQAQWERDAAMLGVSTTPPDQEDDDDA